MIYVQKELCAGTTVILKTMFVKENAKKKLMLMPIGGISSNAMFPVYLRI